MEHKDHAAIEKELESAHAKVKVGSTYRHHKDPTKLYRVTGIAVQEATDKICVIYRAEYNSKLVFVRDLDSWLEEPLTGTPRFRLVKQHENI